MKRSTIRFLYCLAAGVIAAALADPLVERASNAGLFGPGNYTDHSTIDVLPTLILGALFALWFLVVRLRAACVSRAAIGCWLHASNRLLAPRAVVRLLPAVFALQLVTLYVMETIEQQIVAGHVLGGTIWLGAPVAIALSIHALFCAAIALSIAWVLRVLAHAALQIVRLVLELATFVRDELVSACLHFEPPHIRRYAASVPCRICERGPPFVLG
ncbi:MAG: hypothetical protein JO140_03975 [Candidatus Eremiobacteraeota bacterium]|nr:hypothetical protein [Candidatus Eremiobacteraeota bacterium]